MNSLELIADISALEGFMFMIMVDIYTEKMQQLVLVEDS